MLPASCGCTVLCAERKIHHASYEHAGYLEDVCFVVHLARKLNVALKYKMLCYYASTFILMPSHYTYTSWSLSQTGKSIESIDFVGESCRSCASTVWMSSRGETEFQISLIFIRPMIVNQEVVNHFSLPHVYYTTQWETLDWAETLLKVQNNCTNEKSQQIGPKIAHCMPSFSLWTDLWYSGFGKIRNWVEAWFKMSFISIFTFKTATFTSCTLFGLLLWTAFYKVPSSFCLAICWFLQCRMTNQWLPYSGAEPNIVQSNYLWH